jgi:hypothetical protein
LTIALSKIGQPISRRDIIARDKYCHCFENAVVLRLITGVLLGIWLLLVLLGKGGFVHLLLLTGIGVAMVEIVTVLRGKLTK